MNKPQNDGSQLHTVFSLKIGDFLQRRHWHEPTLRGSKQMRQLGRALCPLVYEDDRILILSATDDVAQPYADVIGRCLGKHTVVRGDKILNAVSYGHKSAYRCQHTGADVFNYCWSFASTMNVTIFLTYTDLVQSIAHEFATRWCNLSLMETQCIGGDGYMISRAEETPTLRCTVF